MRGIGIDDWPQSQDRVPLDRRPGELCSNGHQIICGQWCCVLSVCWFEFGITMWFGSALS